MTKARPIPKWIEQCFRFYTLALLLQLALVCVYLNFFFSLILLFLQPPVIWRIMRSIYGQPEGVSYLGVKAKDGNLWWVAFHLQFIFNSFHFLEQFLMLFPGAYSAWLRLWGSEIGSKVNWTPECRLVDRTHLDIGDRVLIGNRCYLAGHAIKKRGDKYLLYVKGVEVGDDAVLSYSVTLAPGAKVRSRDFIEAGRAIYPNEKTGESDE